MSTTENVVPATAEDVEYVRSVLALARDEARRDSQHAPLGSQQAPAVITGAPSASRTAPRVAAT